MIVMIQRYECGCESRITCDSVRTPADIETAATELTAFAIQGLVCDTHPRQPRRDITWQATEPNAPSECVRIAERMEELYDKAVH